MSIIDTIAGLFSHARAASRVPHEYDETTIPNVVRKYQVHSAELYSTHMLHQYERADWTEVPEPLQDFAFAFYRRMQRYQLPMYAHTVYRSPAVQLDLVRRGYSRITSGAHQRSAAVDFVHGVKHWDIPEREFWNFVGTQGKEVARIHSIPIEWGGDWPNFWDPAHWQLANWREYPEIPEARNVHLSLGRLRRA